jgi:hypothetical protein
MKVVCIITARNTHGHTIVKGQIYEVKQTANCGCSSHKWYDIGYTLNHPDPFAGLCQVCNGQFSSSRTIVWADSRCFAEIEYRTAHAELINKKPVEEKSDIPILEPEEVT